MDYQKLYKIEQEIKLLIQFRLTAYTFRTIEVEAYYTLDGFPMCRIELFTETSIISNRIAKYEDAIEKGFYYKAEKSLSAQLEKNVLGVQKATA